MSFLRRLREISLRRDAECFTQCHDWTILEWAGAMAGEAGEAANVAKKIRRDGPSAELRQQLADEIADTLIYLDILAAQEGIDLELAVARKFNEVSRKKGFEETL